MIPNEIKEKKINSQFCLTLSSMSTPDSWGSSFRALNDKKESINLIESAADLWPLWVKHLLRVDTLGSLALLHQIVRIKTVSNKLHSVTFKAWIFSNLFFSLRWILSN